MKYNSKLCVYIVGEENIMLALYRDVSYDTYFFPVVVGDINILSAR